MRALDFHPQIKSDIEPYPAKHFRQILIKCMDLLKNPKPQDSSLMTGYKGLYRVTSGEYRIVYSIEEDRIKIFAIGARNDDEVYKQLARRLN